VRTAIIRTARIIPVSKVNAGLEMFRDAELNLMTKLSSVKPSLKSRGYPVFDFD
jgi:hypothetical protein